MNFLNTTIRYSFYLIFLLVPLVFAGNTSELFEFNKMWLAFGLTTIIGLCWFSKMVLQKKIIIQRTPIDIPILLFLASQIISTIFSLDQHVSWWGYYSRFNGGLLSTITYIFLYYALASNLSRKNVYTLIKFTFIGGILTALWGLPSRFGYDPTCLMFRGTFDTSCWTDAFKPTVRVFSTLGQPAWFAAYLAALLPLSVYYALTKIKDGKILAGLKNWKFLLSSGVIIIFYLNLIFTNTRAGFLAFVAANIVFWVIIFIKKIYTNKVFLRYFITMNALFLLGAFAFGTPIGELHKFTAPGLQEAFAVKSQPAQPVIAQPVTPTPPPTAAPVEAIAQTGITDSGDIRKYVWTGAIDAWKANPIFGTGVETFAFAYYKFRPVGHNMTSEWDYLYNKAHNEYLNYLTTTGLFGLGTYLFFLGLFSLQIAKGVLKKDTQLMNHEDSPETVLLVSALFAGWASILISNFFGFSVVIMNLFLFLFPLFIFMIEDSLNPEKTWKFSWGKQDHGVNPYQWTLITLLTIIAIYFIVSLCRYWYADTKYALGANLDRVGSYQDAYPLLLDAAKIEPNESVYKDELAINVGVLATALAAQKDQSNASQFINNAIALNNEVVTGHPNNVVYWKNRVRLFYTLAQIGDPNQQALYYQEALKAIQKAHELAPTDAKISYNLGVLTGQNGDIQSGITILDETIKMKPDYRDPYFALGLFYHQLSLNPNGGATNAQMQQKAIETYKYILTNINPDDPEVKKSLTEWGVKN